MPRKIRLSINPLLLREIRGRWRMPITMPVLFFYTVFLALMAYLVRDTFPSDVLDLSTDFGRFVGRRFMSAVMLWQVIAWLLVAPVLACGAVSGEREKGLLTGLMLSHLHPREIVVGKWLAIMVFQALLLILPLPIWLVGLSLGGVDPKEVVLGLAIQLATASFGAALGLAASAWTNTTARAFGLAVTYMLLFWVGTTYFAFSVGEERLMFFNPVFSVYGLLDENVRAEDTLNSVLCAVSLGLATYLLLGLARTGLVRVPLEKEPKLDGLNRDVEMPAATPPPGEAMGAASAESEVIHPVQQRKGTTKPHRSGWEHMPIRHAIARRQIRRWTRFTELPAAEVSPPLLVGKPYFVRGLLMICLLALLLGLSLRGSIPGWMQTESEPGLSWLGLGSFVYLFALLFCPVFGILAASSFTREREQGTLNELLLTPLSSVQIMVGFMQSALWLGVGLFSWLCALLPVALLAIAPEILFPAAILWICALFFSLSSGLFFSWIGEHTQIAVAGTIATVFGSVPLVMGGLISEILRYIPPLRWLLNLPIVHFAEGLVALPSPWGFIYRLLILSGIYLLAGLLAFAFVVWHLDHSRWERERRRLVARKVG